MEKYIRKIDRRQEPALAFLLTCITYGVAFSYMGLLSNGKYIIARSDLFQQYLPFIQMLEAVWKGESSFWFSWNVGMGGNTALIHAYYTLSPFNILFFIMGRKYIMEACALVIILKAGLAAVTCRQFLYRFFGQSGIRTVLFSMMYALCGFQVSYYFAISWMDALYMFPVIILCITRLVKEGKWKGLLFSYAYLFFTNFYMGYMAGICSFFLFAVYARYIYEGKGIRIYFKTYKKFFLCVFGAAALTCVIWYPVALEMLMNPSPYGDVFQGTDCNPLFIWNNLFVGQMQSLEGVTPFVYCGIPVLLLLPCYFLNRRIAKKEKRYAAFVILLLVSCMLFLPLNRLMHAFDDPNMLRYRYAYCLTFVFVVLAYRQSRYLKEITGKQIGVTAAVSGCVYILSGILYENTYIRDFNANTPVNFGVNALFIGLWIACAAMYCRRKLEYAGFFTIAAFLLMAELGSNTAMSLYRMEHKAMRREDYQAWEYLIGNTIKDIKEADQGWYRIRLDHMLCKNMGAWYGIQNISEYLAAAENQSLVKGMAELGFYASDTVLYQAGMTPVTELLLGIKYELDLGSDVAYKRIGNDEREVLQFGTKENYLGPGYMVSEKILEYHPETSPFKNQNNLLYSMTGEGEECFEKIEDVELKIEGGEFTQDENGYLLKRQETAKEAVFHFTFPMDGEKAAYAYFDQKLEKYKDGTAGIRTNTTENENISVDLQLYPARIVKTGEKDGIYALDLILGEDVKEVAFQNSYFVYYQEEELEKAFDILKQNQLYEVEMGKRYLKGRVNVTEDAPVLFTTIAYSQGWTVLVDGREEEVLPLADGTFLGVRLASGNHRIEFIYNPPGVWEGIVISVLTACILLMQTAADGFRRRNEKQ